MKDMCHGGCASAVISESCGAIATVSGWLLSIAALPLHLQMHESIHGQHVVIQIRHDDHRAEYQETDHENAKGERENVVGLVRRARDVQEEHQVDPHLRNRE